MYFSSSLNFYGNSASVWRDEEGGYSIRLMSSLGHNDGWFEFIRPLFLRGYFMLSIYSASCVHLCIVQWFLQCNRLHFLQNHSWRYLWTHKNWTQDAEWSYHFLCRNLSESLTSHLPWQPIKFFPRLFSTNLICKTYKDIKTTIDIISINIISSSFPHLSSHSHSSIIVNNSKSKQNH